MLNNFIDKRRGLKAKIIGTLIFCFLAAICLALLLPYSVKKYPILMAFGVVSFALTGVIVTLLSAIEILVTGYQMRKHHPGLFKKSISSSRSTRSEAIRQIRYLKDPRLKKISACTSKIGIFCFLIWLVLFSVVLCIVLIVGDDSFVRAIFGR